MNIKTVWDESRAFVIGRVTAGATYVFGSLTTAGGAAKAATEANVAPQWFPSVTVDTVVLILGAVITVATGLVSIWAKRKDTMLKAQQAERDKANAKMARAEWIMRMLRENGEAAMVSEFGQDWRNRYNAAVQTDLGGLYE